MKALSLILAMALFGHSISMPNCTPKNWSYAWTLVGKTWFTRLETKRTMAEQIEQCQIIEGGESSIATIASALEQKEVSSRLARHNAAFIGAFEIGSSGHWFWWSATTGNKRGPAKITKSFWLKGQPNQAGGANEACAVIGWNDGQYSEWVDIPCEWKQKAICELRCN